MDSVISVSEQQKAKRSKIIRFAWIGAVVIILFFLFRNVLKTSVELDEIRIGKVEQGPIENAITSSGLVVPAFEQIVTSPVSAAIKKVHLRSGTDVVGGELILELEQGYVQLEVDKLQDELELKKNNVTRLKLEYDKNLRELELEDQIKGLQLSSLEAQLADVKRLREVGGATQEEVEKADLALKIARLEKKKLENDLGFRKQSLNSDRRNLELEVQIQEKRLLELQRKLNETKVKAPQEGVITWVNEDIGKQVNEGESLVRLANLTSFRIEATSSDMYADRINTGLPVKVRINGQDLTGYITLILPAVENNTVQFHVSLDDPTHTSLRTNMRVEVYIITERKENVLRVVNGPAFTGAREQEVFVVKGDHAEKRWVRIGLNNLDYVELQGNIQPGEQLIISDTKDYLHLDRFDLKK
ncbi:MAG: HlyD family efflux transporter periplasmic adaptor subunit [Bacteroidota bacterium]